MPFFFDAIISTLHNTILSRLQSNDGGFEPLPLREAYCRSGSLWTQSNTNDRMFLSQSQTNGSQLPLICELRPHYGRLITSILVRVYGQGYSVLPTWMPRVQLLSMNATTSLHNTAWTVEEETVDPSSTVGAYNAAHYIAVTPNQLMDYNMRYAVAVFADQSTTASMVLEGIQVGYAFTA